MTALRDERGRTLPGHTGLPGAGRPPVDPKIRAQTLAILTAAAPKAARRLVELVGSEDEKVALQASEALLSRVYGRPVQQVDAKIETTNVQQAHLQILLELQNRREAKAIDSQPSPLREAETVELVETHLASDQGRTGVELTEPPTVDDALDGGSTAPSTQRRHQAKAAE